MIQFQKPKKKQIKGYIIKGGIMKIYDDEINEWINNCPTHKFEIEHIDENGIVMVVRFMNEPEDEGEK